MRNSLAPRVGIDALEIGLDALANSGRAMPNGADAHMLVAVYAGALAGTSQEAFKHAVAELIAGTTDPTGPEISPVHMPTSAQLAQLCRAIEERMTLRLDHAALMIGRPEARPAAPELPEAVRRQNLARIAALRGRLREDQPRG